MNEVTGTAPTDTTARVLDTREVADAFYHTRLVVPEAVARARPGQFVQLRPRPQDRYSPYLRVPLSVSAADPSAGVVEVLYEEVGSKTSALRRCAAGEEVGCLGPLGNAFPSPTTGGSTILVGGGIGVPPLLYFGSRLQASGTAPRLLVGARCAGKHLPEKLLSTASDDIGLATDDGSLGHHGLITDLLEDALDGAGGGVAVYTCGPHAMMAAVARLCADRRATCHASLEEYMACGFGVCVGCVVGLVDGEAEAGPYGRYSRVCVDGPVYDATRVVW